MELDEVLAAEEGARLAGWLDGLLFRGLCLPDGLTVDQAARERDGARAAATGLAGELWDWRSDGGAGIEARVQAAQFVCAHAAAMDWQAEANRRDLPPHARATSQRLARQLMALTTSQLHALSRLKAERRKDREEAARAAARQTAAEAQARLADRRALVDEMERMLKSGADPEALVDDDAEFDYAADDYADDAGPPAGPAEREPVGAGVPEPPPEPAPPLNRQQRRALERLRRREKRAGAK